MNDQSIEILDENSSLETKLRFIKNSKIDIAVAFASKAEPLIDRMLGNGNTISLTVGTINNFTDPAFIRYCQKLSKFNPKKLNIYVDFRGDNSIHWKLYLIGADSVIIGSPNLTTVGISMRRDTAITVQNPALYQSYLTKIITLKRDYSADILHSQHKDFERKLQEYEIAYRKTFGQMLTSRLVNNNRKQESSIDFLEWEAREKSQILPLFIWDRDATEAEEKLFEDKIIPAINDGAENRSEFYIIGIYEGSPKIQNYHSGEIILTMKSSGHHIRFQLASFVAFSHGRWWLCGLKSHQSNGPFVLTSDLKKLIRQKRYAQEDNEKTYLDSKDLRELATALKLG